MLDHAHVHFYSTIDSSKENQIPLRICLRGIAPSRLLLAVLHSCFGVHSPFEFRVSSFPQTFRTHEDPAGPMGTQPDPTGPIGTSLGPNGTPLGHQKDLVFRLPPTPSQLITALQPASYVSIPRYRNPPKHLFFPRTCPNPSMPRDLPARSRLVRRRFGRCSGRGSGRCSGRRQVNTPADLVKLLP